MLKLVADNLVYIDDKIILPSYLITLGLPKYIPEERIFALSGRYAEIARILHLNYAQPIARFLVNDSIESSDEFMAEFANGNTEIFRLIFDDGSGIITYTEEYVEYKIPLIQRTFRVFLPKNVGVETTKSLIKLKDKSKKDRTILKSLHVRFMEQRVDFTLFALICIPRDVAYFEINITNKQDYIAIANKLYNSLMEKHMFLPHIKKIFPIPRDHPILDDLATYLPNLEEADLL